MRSLILQPFQKRGALVNLVSIYVKDLITVFLFWIQSSCVTQGKWAYTKVARSHSQKDFSLEHKLQQAK